MADKTSMGTAGERVYTEWGIHLKDWNWPLQQLWSLLGVFIYIPEKKNGIENLKLKVPELNQVKLQLLKTWNSRLKDASQIKL